MQWQKCNQHANLSQQNKQMQNTVKELRKKQLNSVCSGG